MTILSKFVEPLKKGHQLENVTAGKKVAVATAGTTFVASVITAILASNGLLHFAPPEVIMTVSSLIVSGVSAVLGYLTVATTQKIGR
jgi:hypothetical protein